MSDNPWETPRHDRPMTHAPVNPTPAWQPPPADFGQSWSPPAGSGGFSGGGGVGGAIAYSGPRKKSMVLAIILSVVLGPLGLFYIGIISGIAALVIVPFVVRTIAFGVAFSTGGSWSLVEKVGIGTAWLICVPWAVIAVKLRNARIDRTG